MVATNYQMPDKVQIDEQVTLILLAGLYYNL